MYKKKNRNEFINSYMTVQKIKSVKSVKTAVQNYTLNPYNSLKSLILTPQADTSNVKITNKILHQVKEI